VNFRAFGRQRFADLQTETAAACHQNGFAC
jgi:hypothetical protein